MRGANPCHAGARHRIWLAATCLCLLFEVAAASKRTLCVEPAVYVTGEHSYEVAEACDAIRRAVPFLQSNHLAVPLFVEIRLVDTLAREKLDIHELGHFDSKTGRILVRSNANQRAGRLPWTVSTTSLGSPAYWASYVAHEFAHAALWQTPCTPRPCQAVFEYVAAVVQLASLPDDVLATLLDEHKAVDAFEDVSDASIDLYLMNPQLFAVMAYKHYSAQPDPPAYIRQLIGAP